MMFVLYSFQVLSYFAMGLKKVVCIYINMVQKWSIGGEISVDTRAKTYNLNGIIDRNLPIYSI